MDMAQQIPEFFAEIKTSIELRQKLVKLSQKLSKSGLKID